MQDYKPFIAGNSWKITLQVQEARKIKMLETLESRQVKPNYNRDDF